MVDRNLPYVWDNAIQENGVTWSSPLDYILTHGGELSDTIDTSSLMQLCVLRYGTNSHPLVNQCECNKSESINYTSLSTSFHNKSNGSYGVMLMIGNTTGGATNDDPDFECFGRWSNQNLKTGEISSGNYGNSYIPNGRVAIGNLDLSHFALVPFITAYNNNGTASCTGASLKDYKALYAATYPHITLIGYQIYYKPDLNSAYYTSTDIRLVGTPIMSQSYHYDIAYSDYNDVTTQIIRNRFVFLSELYQPVRIGIRTITVYNPFVPVMPETYSLQASPYGTSSTHSPSTQRVQVTDYSTTQIPSSGFGCITFGTAMSIINSVGLWVCDDPSTIEVMSANNTTSDGVYAPVINEQGVPTGAIQGGGSSPATSVFNQNWNKLTQSYPIAGGDATGAVNINTNTPINYSGVTGQTNITDFQEGDPELLPQSPTVSGMGIFANYYALGQTEILSLNDFLWHSDDNIIDQIIAGLALFGQNPINAIVSLRLYPFNVAALAPTLAAEPIILGRVDTGVNGIKLPSNSATILNLGSISLSPKFNDFRDYQPYTSYCLYIPFIGTVVLNPNIYLGHIINIKMVVDITTGKATGLIYCDNILMEMHDGMIGVEIPVTSENMSQMVNAVTSAVGNTAIAAMSTGPAGAAFTAVGGAAEVAFSDVGINKTGNVGAAGAFSMPIVPYLIISTPNAEIPANYAHTYGLISNTSGVLSSYKGFTICENVDVSGIANATAEERDEIKNTLENGVYI